MRSETLPSVIYFMGSETLPSVTLWGRKRFLLSVASDPDQEYIYFFLVILIKNIYTLRGRKRFLLPITYFYSTCKKEPFPTPSMGTETLPSACYILSCYILIKNIYTLWGLKRFLLSVTYFPTNASFCLLHTFRRALPSACYILSDEDQEYIHFMGSETHPSACYILSDESTLSLLPVTYFPTNQSACYILSDESSITFNSTSNRA